jgi:hypothetical protein
MGSLVSESSDKGCNRRWKSFDRKTIARSDEEVSLRYARAIAWFCNGVASKQSFVWHKTGFVGFDDGSTSQASHSTGCPFRHTISAL